MEVSWGDCDAAGVVFYPRYYAWFDAGTHAMLTAAGLDHHTLKRRHGALTPLVKASAGFASPATFGDTLEVRSWIAEVGTKSFRVAHRITLGDRLVVEGEEVRVWALPVAEADGAPGAPRMRTAPIPDEVREIFSGASPGSA